MSQSGLHLTQPLLGRRREGRLRVELRARLITHEGVFPCALADIAYNGARIYLPGCALRSGRDAILVWEQFEAFGDVVWNNGDFLALRFEEPLVRSVLLGTRQAEDARSLPLQRQLTREAAQAFVNARYKL